MLYTMSCSEALRGVWYKAKHAEQANNVNIYKQRMYSHQHNAAGMSKATINTTLIHHLPLTIYMVCPSKYGLNLGSPFRLHSQTH
jgi:hypothetical protein